MDSEASIYGDHREGMEQCMAELTDALLRVRSDFKAQEGADPVDHILCRIKSEASMREKCHRLGLPENELSALNIIKDAIGIRLVCPFISDVYHIRDAIASLNDCEIVNEKDYIRYAKPNGYRSYHIILRYKSAWYVEIQLRTISMDTWAALEHQLRYKKQIGSNVELIYEELKRCADELASTDITLQTIRDMIVSQEEG
ncbi:MAG: GTP pyrophosphokinase family protein [Clostridia bacterium]|nr:GTP pyrophosphokinase family protein [Clostridia bacterium]MBQ8962846.1 GTP pyrophosphokinase family protein [Clostridia bacterium]